jgi:hypothetical protein
VLPPRPRLSEAQISRSVMVDYSYSQAVRGLVEIAGVIVTAAIGGATKSSQVREWIAGVNLPADREDSMRFALRLAIMISQQCGSGMVQGWFKGSNSSIGDEAPSIALAGPLNNELRNRLLSEVRELIS